MLKLLATILLFLPFQAHAETMKIPCDMQYGGACYSWLIAKELGFLPPYVELLSSSSGAEQVAYLRSGKVDAVSQPAAMFQCGLNGERSEQNECVTVGITFKKPDWIILTNDTFTSFVGARFAGTGCGGYPTTIPLVLSVLSGGDTIPTLNCTTERVPGAITIVSGLPAPVRIQKILSREVDAGNAIIELAARYQAQIERNDPEVKGLRIFLPLDQMPNLPAAGLAIAASMRNDPVTKRHVQEVMCAHVRAVQFANNPNEKLRYEALVEKIVSRNHPNRTWSKREVQILAEYLKAGWSEDGKHDDMKSVQSLYYRVHDSMIHPSQRTSASQTIREFWSKGRHAPFWDFSWTCPQ
jgi:hypothetical protein